ncbi:MAG: 8-oxoguanine deaminase [Pseudonocardiales bacterium]|nr:8-oxoguanine deaminase [Pseudonocardiales bacterium]
MTTVLQNCAVVTMDESRNEYASGHVVVDGNRIAAVGAGVAAAVPGATVIDAAGCLATPGLVNTHHHLYQWLTRGLAPDATLFEWLTTLYPIWARIDEELVHLAAGAALARLAASGCTTSSDHHYVFPQGSGDLLAAEIAAAQQVGLRFHATRGSMDLGRSAGGLPPDHVVEDRDTILAASADAIDRWHDTSFDAMVRVALAPCSPFSVTGELMRESADLARSRNVRLHTHLAETVDEDDFCRERFGCSPLEYVENLGWSGPDVWYAHGIHFDDAAIKRLGAAGSAVAHCPTSNGRLGAGIARAMDLRTAGATVGLGVDGAASSEASSLLEEVRHAVLFARARGGPAAMTVRDALELATVGGAAVLGRSDEIGSLETGKLADIALWRLDTPAHAGITDPVAALVLGSPPPLRLLLVNGRTVVQDGVVQTVDEDALAVRVAAAHRTLVSP